MSWFQKLLNKLRGKSKDTRQDNESYVQIVARVSKVDITRKSIPNKLEKVGSLDTKSTQKFEVAKISKVDHQFSSRARPNNPTTQALVDKLTMTIDAEE